ncbi:MAG: DUF4394 domain-containing protein [Verrucomicrobiota bacterium]
MNIFRSHLSLSLAAASVLLTAASAEAQLVFAVDDANNLLRFDASTPGLVTTVGNIGFAPKGMDFNPANGLLYAINVGAVNTQLFTIDLTTAATTAVGNSFLSVGVTPAAYNLGAADHYGFDFNPKTLQGDGSIRIRLVSSDGDNLRLNSSTGQISNVDGNLNGAATTAVGTAYANNLAGVPASGTTTLFQISPGSDSLYTQVPPNDGTLVLRGPLGVDAKNAIGFDIYTAGDGTTNTAYVATDANAAVAGAELYTVDLATGTATPVGTNGLIGLAGVNVVDIAVQPLPVPEPGVYGMLITGIAMLGLRRRRS